MSYFGRKKAEDAKPDTNTAIGTKVADAEDNFVPASTWKGLEWIGTPAWERRRNVVVDGHKFDRYVPDDPAHLLCRCN